MTVSVEIAPTPGELTRLASDRLVALIRQQLAHQDRFRLALAGGNTPKPVYEALAQADLPWEQLEIFWGDERFVPPTHPDSNEHMARLAWLDRVPIPAENIYPMPTEGDDPAHCAQQYEADLRRAFGLAAGEWPMFDLILLGLGDDGHTASLFPHTAALQVTDRLVTVGDRQGQPRLTLTVPVLNAARQIWFLVAGASKVAALGHIFAAEDDAQTWPARLVRPQGELFWLLDAAAAAGLPD
jgi:6-phosphogluconolactonase